MAAEAHLFAEGSNTTADDRDLPLKKYYRGLFGVVTSLHDELGGTADAHLHVLDEAYGVANGDELRSSLSALTDGQQPSDDRRSSDGQRTVAGFEAMASDGRAELLGCAPDADVLVVLLSTDVFRATVGEVWTELVEAAKPESIWCLGAARSALDELDFEALEKKGCTVLTYQRVGVARIGTDTRAELLDTVSRRAVQ